MGSSAAQRVLDEDFTNRWIGRPLSNYQRTDAIDRSFVTADKQALVEAPNRLVEVASRTVAHRSRVEPEALKVREVDTVFDVIERTLQKYLALLTGASWAGFEPSPVFNMTESFKFPGTNLSFERGKQSRTT